MTRARPILAEDKRVVAIDRFVRDFPSWRAKAIEPVIHEAVSCWSRTDPQLSGLVTVGGWWDRSEDHEYDLVGAEQNGEVTVVGTIKWRARRAVTVEELSRLSGARSVVPRAGGAKLAVVCPAGAPAGVHPDVLLDAGDVLDAFRRVSPGSRSSCHVDVVCRREVACSRPSATGAARRTPRDH